MELAPTHTQRLLLSSCDFLACDERVPWQWRLVLKPLGTMRGFGPRTGADGEWARGEWSLGEVLMEPLFYNPRMRGEWGERILDDASVVRDACGMNYFIAVIATEVRAQE